MKGLSREKVFQLAPFPRPQLQGQLATVTYSCLHPGQTICGEKDTGRLRTDRTEERGGPVDCRCKEHKAKQEDNEMPWTRREPARRAVARTVCTQPRLRKNQTDRCFEGGHAAQQENMAICESLIPPVPLSGPASSYTSDHFARQRLKSRPPGIATRRRRARQSKSAGPYQEVLNAHSARDSAGRRPI